MHADVPDVLASRASGIRFDDLSEHDRDQLRLLVLDSVAVAFAGSRCGTGQHKMWSYAGKAMSDGNCSVIGASATADPEFAAFLNGGFAHVLNYDAVGVRGEHTGVSAVVAPLAVAEYRDSTVGEFLSGVAAASLVSSHVAGLVEGREHGWLNGQVQGVFGAAAGAGRVLGLSPTEMSSALGLALLQASGTKQVMTGGAKDAKLYYGAFANRSGVLSARLAAEGLDASGEWLHGEFGMVRMFYGSPSSPDAESVEPDLSTDYIFKDIPASLHVAPFVAAAVQARQQLDAPLPTLSRIVIRASRTVETWLTSIEECIETQGAGASDSIPFGVACGLEFGEMTVRHLTLENMSGMLPRFGGRIETVVLPDGRCPAIELHYDDGRSVVVMVQEARRATADVRDIVHRKAMECLCGLGGIPGDRVESFIDALSEASGSERIRSTMGILSAGWGAPATLHAAR